MPKKPVLTASVVLAVALLGWWIYSKVTHEEPQAYRLTPIERGDLESAVSATGTLNAVTTVQIGTQVSGKVAEIFADFNDAVKKGQLIARIDPTLQQQSVQAAQAALERNRAEAERTRQEYERNKRLFESKVLTEVEFNTAKYADAVARANVKAAQVTLDREKRNLDYTSIYSPIDGIVIERTVSVGQTVAASYSTPQLFLIANDLSQMQILASVDESDIGAIKQGQPVRFTVQAYPNESFQGTVEQVRLQSKTTENVVNYTVAIDVRNPSGKLLPGMTATAEFLTGAAKNILMVPNAALRFRPPEAMMAQLREAEAKRKGSQNTSGAAGGNGNGATGADAGSGSGGRSPVAAAPQGPAGTGRNTHARRSGGTLWYLDEKSQPAVLRVRTGISDGQKTEIKGKDIKEGLQVIIGVTQTEQPKSGLFSPAPQQQGPRRGGF